MSEIVKRAILFPNNHTALAVLPSTDTKVEEIIEALCIPAYNAVMLIIGSASSLDETLLPKLTQIYSRGIAKAAVQANALLIDGGTAAGVMALMGEGVAARGYQSSLIGVSPAGKISYPGVVSAESTPLEPNHSHFVLAKGEGWGSETATLFSLLTEFNKKVPAIVILAAGGAVSKNEVLQTVRLNLPLVVIEGSGGLADEIAAAYKENDKPVDDPLMAEIIADGDLHFHPLISSVNSIGLLIIRQLGIDKVLLQVWETFARYDLNATLQQKRFNRMQQAIILVGVTGVALVIIQQVFAPRNVQGKLMTVSLAGGTIFWWIIYHLLILIPIVLTVLVTAANRFRQGNKWLLLRAGAEAIKREIYRYRTRALEYAANSDQQLSKKVEGITRRTMLTEVNLSALVPYNRNNGFPPYMDATRGGDDGFSRLTPDRYVAVRLADQLNYFQKKTPKLERQLSGLYWMTFIVGGAGTFLAATGMQVWVALSTSIVTALGTYLGYRQTENILMKYNQAATDLTNVKAWWEALSVEEKAGQANIDSLVEHTEQVLQAESDGWIQQMQNALADLRKGQEHSDDKKDNKGHDESKLQPTTQKVNKQNGNGKQENLTVEKEAFEKGPSVS